MPPNNEARVMSDHKLAPRSFYHKIGLTFLGLTILVGLVFAGYAYYAAPALLEQQSKADNETFFRDLQATLPPFTYEIVPNAPSLLLIPEPPTVVTQELSNEFEKARAQLSVQTDNEIESIYDLPVGEVTYLEYQNEIARELQDPLLQMLGEVELLVQTLNKKYPQETLASRLNRESDLLYRDAVLDKNGHLSIYPSMRVAEAHLIGEIL